MSEQKLELLSPVGRIVAGDVWKSQDKDAEGRPLVYKSGANIGQPRVSYYIGLAIAKNDPAWPEIWGKIAEVAKAKFPQYFDAAGNCNNPSFAFKVTDGDSTVPNTKGKRPCDREGYPGHWVVNFSNGFDPAVYNTGGKQVLTDPNSIKRGYFVRVYFNIDGNGSAQQPGIFLNHTMVEFIAYGEEIHAGPDGSVFADTPAAQLPAGATTTPPNPQTTIATGQTPPGPGNAAPGPQGPGAGTPPPPQQQAGPGGGPSTPATDYLNGGATPPPPPQQQAAKTYNYNGAQYTAEQLRASGWSDEQIAALG